MVEDLYDLIGGRSTVEALGGRVYTGKNLRDAHALSRDRGLNNTHFDLFLQHFRAALEKVGVKPENAEKVRQRLESKRGAVLDQAARTSE